MIPDMAGEERHEVVVDLPNRRKASSKTTRWIVVLLLLLSAGMMAFVLIGGWAGPPGSEAIVDGQLTRVYVGKLRPGPLAMYVYDACLVEAVASRR